MVDDIVIQPRAERISFDMLVRYRNMGNRATVMLKNLTTGGARVEGIEGLRYGDVITLLLPSLKPKDAHVVWVSGSSVGLEFDRPLHKDVFEGLVLHHGRQRARTEADRALQIDARAFEPLDRLRHAA